MDKVSVYEYKDYKKFILDWIERGPNEGRGQRKLLAEAIGCATPFISHVLGGHYHLSLEQGEACARWMRLNDNDTEYFLLLISKQRAGTKSLEHLYEKQLSQKRNSQLILKKRLNIEEQMTPEDQMIYYSHWFFAAIHMACLNPQLQTIEAIQSYFQLSLHQVSQALEFLTEHRLLEEKRGRYQVLKPVLHLEKESPLMVQHHTQWRLKALDAFTKKRHSDLFYSGVISLSKDDYEWMQEKLSALLEEAVSRIRTSDDEILACLNFDWFAVGAT